MSAANCHLHNAKCSHVPPCAHACVPCKWWPARRTHWTHTTCVQATHPRLLLYVGTHSLRAGLPARAPHAGGSPQDDAHAGGTRRQRGVLATGHPRVGSKCKLRRLLPQGAWLAMSFPAPIGVPGVHLRRAWPNGGIFRHGRELTMLNLCIYNPSYATYKDQHPNC